MIFGGTVLWAVLASLFATVFGGLYMIGAFRTRKAKEPPLDKGFIPWLGYGIHFRKNTVGFLKRMMKKHGDIFTVLIGGKYLHFVMDPHSYSCIIKESPDKLDFVQFGSYIVSNAFDFNTSETHHNIVQTISKKYLNGKNLAVLNEVMLEKLQAVLLHSQDSGERKRPWQQDGVFHFSYKTIFQAAFLTLFGTEPETCVESNEKAGEENPTPSGKLHDDFQKFDSFFPQMAFNILDPIGKKETQRLKHIFWNMLSTEKIYRKDNISSWVIEQDRQMAEMGMSEKVRTRFFFLLLWASQANTGPATFWIFLYLLKSPEAMKAVREELDSALREIGPEVKPGSPIINVTLNMLKTPLLDSAIQEALRLKASPLVFRSVMQDTEIKMADGREYVLRKGDHLLLFPYISLHMDPEIYPEPQSFKYDRFFNSDGTRKAFYKNGKKLKHYSMPFGAGLFMCPGRFFAVNEMKMFVILMLTYFDMELVNPEKEIPPVDGSRHGLGIMQPSHDIQFRYRLRV